MRRSFLIIWMMGVVGLVSGQKYDNNWVFGFPNATYSFDSSSIYKVDTFPLSKSIFFTQSGGCMSDKNGNLLFVSNGLQINDRNDNLMEGGDQLALGALDTATGGYDFRQNPLSLPMPGNDSLYYFFYESYWNTAIPEASRLYYGIIDMSANNGLGKVISVNNVLIDTFISDGGLGACKHANGQDWWLVKPQYETNNYFEFLVKKAGVVEGPFMQSIGIPSQIPDWNCDLVFSPQGDKMFYGNGIEPPTLFDFDRCTGLLSNAKYCPSLEGSGGASFSPNGRFIYIGIADSFKLYQLDTYSDNIDSSKILLAAFNPLQYNFPNNHQLGPDSKIYIDGYNSPTPLSIINFPDSFGFACGLNLFVYDTLPGNTLGMPNFPYYRTPPARAYKADAGSDTTICLGDTVMLGAPQVDSVVYQWQSGAAFLSSTDIAQPLVAPQQTTSYYLTINDTVPRGYSCNVRVDTVTVYVVTPPCILGIASVNNDMAASVKVYPNPANDYTTINYGVSEIGDGPVSLEITDVLGQVVYTLALPMYSGFQKLDVMRFAPGIYNVAIKRGGAVLAVEKLVKE